MHEVENEKPRQHNVIMIVMCFLAALVGSLLGGYAGDWSSRKGEMAQLEERVSTLQVVHMSILKDLVILESKLRRDAIAYNQLLRQMSQQIVAQPAKQAKTQAVGIEETINEQADTEDKR